MQKINKIFSIFVIIVFSQGGCTRLQAQCDSRVVTTVEQFLKYDFNGYRLGSKGHEAIWDLTEKNGEPPATPITVTKSYKILSVKKQGKACLVLVHFITYGYFPLDTLLDVFRRKPKEVDQIIFVNCDKEKCQIDIAPSKFEVPPHPGKEATEMWLKTLESIRNTKEGKRKIGNLRRVISDLP